MPEIKIGKVLSFSSEDPVHVANNILSNDTSKKWKSHSVGERSVNIVLQLEEAAVISGIDIGNEHSAYVEVLVSRSCSNEDYKVLLVMSSFMSPVEARQSSNINRVRMFSHDDLMKPQSDEKWDLVKIVCTQPFNRHVQYGLSFIKLHTSHGKNEENQNVNRIGKFALRPESPNNIAIGSLFAKKKELKEEKPLTAAAAIRTASLSPQSLATNSKKLKLPQTPTTSNKDIDVPSASRKRDEIFYSKDDEEPNEKIDLLIEQKKLEKEKLEKKLESEEARKKLEKEQLQNKATPTKPVTVLKDENRQSTKTAKQHKDSVDVKPGSSRGGSEVSKRKLNSSESPSKKKAKKQLTKPFHELLNGVVIVISGIQNPDRSNIRTMAVSMGAKYKADWDNTATHLICAFPNTPKFNQVKGKGKIVTKSWITDCHSKRRRLPWRRYALDKSDKAKNESEEEIFEEIEEPSATSDDENRDAKSGSDTEDEIERINTLQQRTHVENKNGPDVKNARKASAEVNGSSADQNMFDCSTDEETEVSPACTELPDLPNLFEDKFFYIDDNLDAIERKALVKYISACNGTITTSLTESVHFVISTKELKIDLGDIHSESKAVDPSFVYECFNSKEILPPDDFII